MSTYTSLSFVWMFKSTNEGAAVAWVPSSQDSRVLRFTLMPGPKHYSNTNGHLCIHTPPILSKEPHYQTCFSRWEPPHSLGLEKEQPQCSQPPSQIQPQYSLLNFQFSGWMKWFPLSIFKPWSVLDHKPHNGRDLAHLVQSVLITPHLSPPRPIFPAERRQTTLKAPVQRVNIERAQMK